MAETKPKDMPEPISDDIGVLRAYASNEYDDDDTPGDDLNILGASLGVENPKAYLPKKSLRESASEAMMRQMLAAQCADFVREPDDISNTQPLLAEQYAAMVVLAESETSL